MKTNLSLGFLAFLCLIPIKWEAAQKAQAKADYWNSKLPVERRVEDQPERERREAHLRRGQDLRSPGRPHGLVGHRGGGRLERDEEQAGHESGEGQEDEGLSHEPAVF